MRQKKIRGHNRIHKKIEAWRNAYLLLNLHHLQGQQRSYAKITVSPYANLSLTNSAVPYPKGKTRLLVLSTLLDIYESWKLQLDKTGQPYYLKVWLFEPRSSSSQVVCAFGDMLHFYDNTFNRSPNKQTFDPKKYGPLSNRLQKYTWNLHLDEDLTSDETTTPVLKGKVWIGGA